MTNKSKVGIHILELHPELGGCVPKVKYVKNLADAIALLNDGWFKTDWDWGSPKQQYLRKNKPKRA